jgi:uncharacterized circularly permuted ATP-grasp superfamily protein/uncharacterized alpha-E superfamily protein
MAVPIASVAKPGNADPEPLLAGYRPLPGIFDEMVDREGHPRAHWRTFLAQFAGLGVEEITRRFAAADHYLREAGVFYRASDDPTGRERPWPLSHVPLLIAGSEWQRLADGLIQRAELLEAVLADAYAASRLVTEGRLPAAIIAGNPEFLRPLSGVKPRGGAFLRFFAVDVGRSPDGRWWVLGDRTQAPSGAGYTLENRLALSRALPDVYRALSVERLAPFFQALQSELSSLNHQEESRVCVLTPGPMSETYFEHAYLARNLGFLLVEGEDLTVREDGVFIRTVSGLKRAEVLLRRLDADFADPLELNARSRLGVPGLVQAIRDGHITMANALGSGVVEARALLSFLPAIASPVLGSGLKLPNVATWWLGQARARDEVVQRLDTMVIGGAFPGSAPIQKGRAEVLGAALDPTERADLLDAIAHRGIDFVAQEAVALSTTPVWNPAGRLEPRPFILRLYLARIDGGWRVLPGGFVRVADNVDARAISLQQGGRTADAWVVSEQPVGELAPPSTPERLGARRPLGTLPSRAAANLFWVARYVERAEATLRLVRALVNRETESDAAASTVVGRITDLLVTLNAVPEDETDGRPASVAATALQNGLDGALPYLVSAAQAAASVIRDRFSPDAWRALTDLSETIKAPLEHGPTESATFTRINDALRIIAAFSGFAQENMNQHVGWRFLELGRRVERAMATCRFMRQFAFGGEQADGLDVLLELADSQITYRLRYVMAAARIPVVDLVVLDSNNPRSLAFQLNRIETHLAALPRREEEGRLSPPERIAVALATAIRTADDSAIDASTFETAENALAKLSDVIGAMYFTTRDRTEAGWEVLG